VSHWVLCVDDDPTILVALKQTLVALDDVIVDVATSAKDARDRIAARDYAVIIADHAMPGETGVELLSDLAENDSPMVRILLTGFADLKLSLHAINEGHVFALLEKPIQSRELLVTVRSAVTRYELTQTLHTKITELEQANEALTVRNEELRRAHREMQRLESIAATDLKTGLANFRFFVDRLAEEMARANRYSHPLALLLIDLDGFKAVNDRHGHLQGDQVLKEVADILRSSVRIMDVLARYGGDEFALILPDTELAGAATLGERLRVRVAQSKVGPANPGEITLSMGMVALPHHTAKDSTEFIELADRALYRAKQSGKNRCVVHEARAN
jgi:diguanylate cyclase (GGDEF)-like protein